MRGTTRSGRSSALPVVLLVGVLVAVLGGAWWYARGGPSVLPFGESCEAVASDSVAQLDPEQAGNAALIATLAVRRSLPARAASIAIATAMQESKLRNVEYGDRDSLGLFQQRPSQGWGTRAQVLDPVHATNAFYDHLVKIDGFESMPITEVAQRIQRSAYPQAYAQHEPEARVLASALSGYSPAAFTCRLRRASTPTSSPLGDDGLTANARAVAAAAATETGFRARAAAGGRALTFTVTGDQAARRAWSLAQWAVARSGELEVVAVRTDGRVWDRTDGKGWKRSTTPTAAGTVQVTVAAATG
jgi:hypothetical protein